MSVCVRVCERVCVCCLGPAGLLITFSGNLASAELGR